MSVEPFWAEINETALRQGDHLPQCLVPGFGPDLSAAGTHEVTADEYDLIVVTQSCDLEASYKATCMDLRIRQAG